MNQELIAMAKAAGLWKDLFAYPEFKEHIKAFAKLVAAAEREKIDKLFDTDLGCCYDAMGQEALNQMRAAIKARGDTT
jgi:hypothetical protein